MCINNRVMIDPYAHSTAYRDCALVLSWIIVLRHMAYVYIRCLHGMVQANVGQCVTLCNPSLGLIWYVSTYDKLRDHNTQHKQPTNTATMVVERGATRPSSSVDLMTPHHLSGGQPCACSFRGHR